MKNFIDIIEIGGERFGYNEVPIYNNELLVIGINYQIWKEDKNGIFQLHKENKELF